MSGNLDVDQAKRELTEFYAELLDGVLKKASAPTLVKLEDSRRQLEEAVKSVKDELASKASVTNGKVESLRKTLAVPLGTPDPDDGVTPGVLLATINAKLDSSGDMLRALAPGALADRVVTETAEAIAKENSPLRAVFADLVQVSEDRVIASLQTAETAIASSLSQARSQLQSEARQVLDECGRIRQDLAGSDVQQSTALGQVQDAVLRLGTQYEVLAKEHEEARNSAEVLRAVEHRLRWVVALAVGLAVAASAELVYILM
jgi:hypothetical protein